MIFLNYKPSRTALPDAELTGVFDRAAELHEQLREEYLRTQLEADVNERIKNLFHEILVKVRSAFDMTWHRVWDKHGRPNWTKTKEPFLYFPIRDTATEFDDAIRDFKKGAKLDLPTTLPKLYDYVRSIQPFSLNSPHWAHLRDLSNLGKHVRLAKQTRKFEAASMFRGPDGQIIMWSKGGVKFSGELHGIPIDPATGEPATGVEDTVGISLCYDLNGKLEMFPEMFSCMSIQYGEAIVARILSLI